jgi:hypothetical protein
VPAQFKTARLLLLRDGYRSQEGFLGRCRMRSIALQQNAVQARTAILHVVALTQYRSNRYMMRVRVTATASSPGEVAIVGPKSRE